ncbi:MAG: EF-P lysine aminoacylase GenX [Planctomycetaceae bacterium]|nr:MAG: EF-P lysine aminoacylase GenX [Planctomycetaceae bacterium]
MTNRPETDDEPPGNRDESDPSRRPSEPPEAAVSGPVGHPDDLRDQPPRDRELVINLRARAALLRRVRQFFDDRGFTEVQPPCLSRDQIVDAHIDPIEIAGSALRLPAGVAAPRYYLQTSPELAMKRLLTLGIGSIYSLGPVFRGGERSVRHNVEFTMLEWYAVGAGFDEVIGQTIAMVREVLGIGPPQMLSYRQLFRDQLGIDPIDCPPQALCDLVAEVDEELARGFLEPAIGAGDAELLSDARDAMLDVLLTETIEPRLGDASLVIRNYPLSQAALARPSPDDPQTAERFEWMLGGLELANGYHELLDADELRRRNLLNNRKRVATGRQPLPVDSSLLAAMRRGLPACSGVALGFDRLVMLAQGTKDIADVIPLTIEEA